MDSLAVALFQASRLPDFQNTPNIRPHQNAMTHLQAIMSCISSPRSPQLFTLPNPPLIPVSTPPIARSHPFPSTML